MRGLKGDVWPSTGRERKTRAGSEVGLSTGWKDGRTIGAGEREGRGIAVEDVVVASGETEKPNPKSVQPRSPLPVRTNIAQRRSGLTL